MVPRPFVVRERSQETADTWSLWLVPTAGDAPYVEPGQFVMVYAFGIGEVPISVSGSGDAVVLTVRAVGAVTEGICASVPGSVLGLRGPFGTTWPVASSAGRDVVVVAGGIGLAPLRTLLLHAHGHPDEYGRVALLYGARTPAQLLYRTQLEKWGATVTVDAAEAGWHGTVGVVPKLIPSARFDATSAVAFVCGPELMMKYAVEALLARGMSPQRVHVSLERNMQCGVGHCGHCQLGPTLICRDGPVYRYSDVARWMAVRDL
jgi:anaerobic sulfite reductase subunit B